MAYHTITLTVNGSGERLDVPSNMTLLQMLREKLALTGTKNGCEAGECGACTILLDGEPVNSCMMLAVEADGRALSPSAASFHSPVVIHHRLWRYLRPEMAPVVAFENYEALRGFFAAAAHTGEAAVLRLA